MKILRQFLIISVIIISFVSCQKKPGYTIDGVINMEEGTIYLQSFRNKMFFTIDSAKIENGKFNFTGNLEREDLFGLTTDPNEEMFPWFIFLENNPISVIIDIDNRRSADVSGSVSNDLYQSYLANRANFRIDSFIREHPSSVVAAYIHYRDFPSVLSIDEIENNLAAFDPSLANVPYIKEMRDVVANRKKLEREGVAPDFAGTTPDGDELNLSDFRGKYVLLRFWASWCGPCRRENPSTVFISEKYREHGFEVFAVSLDSKKNDWLKAIDDDRLDWNHVSELKLWDSHPAQMYGVRNIPASFLIDPDGKIVGRNLKGDELDQFLSKELL